MVYGSSGNALVRCAAVIAAALLLGGCPNGCNWPEDECGTALDCLAGELCVWTGNDGVGGHDFCLAECAVDQIEPCGRVECDPDRMWGDEGHACLNPGTDPTFETYDASGVLVATGAYALAPLGVNEYPCACPSAVRDGTWLYYYDDGALRGEVVYESGRLSEESYWDEQGNPVDTLPPRSEE